MMELIPAEDTKKLSLTQPPSPRQLSEQGVVVPYSTPEGNLSKDEIVVLLALLEGLLGEVMSSDIMQFAVDRARKICQAVEVSEPAFQSAMRKILTIWQDKRKRNPLSGLF